MTELNGLNTLRGFVRFGVNKRTTMNPELMSDDLTTTAFPQVQVSSDRLWGLLLKPAQVAGNPPSAPATHTERQFYFWSGRGHCGSLPKASVQFRMSRPCGTLSWD